MIKLTNPVQYVQYSNKHLFTKCLKLVFIFFFNPKVFSIFRLLQWFTPLSTVCIQAKLLKSLILYSGGFQNHTGKLIKTMFGKHQHPQSSFKRVWETFLHWLEKREIRKIHFEIKYSKSPAKDASKIIFPN